MSQLCKINRRIYSFDVTNVLDRFGDVATVVCDKGKKRYDALSRASGGGNETRQNMRQSSENAMPQDVKASQYSEGPSSSQAID